MVDEFGTGAFSMVVVEDMPLKDVQKLKNKFEEIEHVKKVLCRQQWELLAFKTCLLLPWVFLPFELG